jgi:hypothetical protein
LRVSLTALRELALTHSYHSVLGIGIAGGLSRYENLYFLKSKGNEAAGS